MKPEELRHAIQLSEKVGHTFIVTAGSSGIPHMASAGSLKLNPDERIEVTEWYCPGTVDNLQSNRNISLVVWDAAADRGYQLSGTVEKIEELHMLNGYVREIETKSPVPQIERMLIIKVEKVLDFRHAPHTDIERQ